MIPSLYSGPFNRPDSIVTKKDLDSAVTNVQNLIRDIPSRICRPNSTTGAQPTAVELNNVSPLENEVIPVILSDGTQEIWQYTDANGWQLKLSIVPGAGGGDIDQGGATASTDALCVTSLVLSDTDGNTTDATYFDDGSRNVTVVENRSAHLASNCSWDKEIILDMTDNTYWMNDGGASLITHPAPKVARYFGTVDARQFAIWLESEGETYCNNYHQCFVYDKQCVSGCVLNVLTISWPQIDTSDASDYTIDWGDGVETFASGTTPSHTYTDIYSGKIEVCFNKEVDAAFVFEFADLTGNNPKASSTCGCH